MRSLGVVCWALMLVSFCSCSAPEKLCEADNVCGKAQICVEGRCVSGCREDSQCPAEQRCVNNKCDAQVCKSGDKRDCYGGAAETLGKGSCKGGFQLCRSDGSGWTPCYEQVVPVAEICDGADNNCDGQVDEKLTCDCTPGQSRRCYTGPLDSTQQGLCRAGIQYCTAKNKWGPCLDQVMPRREICDGLDNDCNGKIDDQIDCTCQPGATRECYSGPDGTPGVGLCRKGQQVCSPERRWQPCYGQVLPTLEENQLCNGQDDNCDGHVDNVSGTQEPLKKLCYSGVSGNIISPCEQGLSTCTNKTWSACQGEVTPQEETCNSKDDDCNGKIDDLKVMPCFTGKTGCTQVGDTYQCKGNCAVGQKLCEQGQWTECQGQTLATDKDQCGDGIDNDCNGIVDDQCVCATGQKQACYPGPQETRNRGGCKDGEQTCTNNQWGPCVGAVLPQTETCNGKDDNCDGDVDNISDLGQSCSDPQRKGECRNGIYRCKEIQANQWAKVCEQTTQPSASEICNGKDDDCDGTIDNIPDLKQTCLIAQAKGNCSQGEWQCVRNATTYEKICQPTKPARTEICNGEDDNCDGIVDNIGTPCIVNGQQGSCQYGRTLCQRVQQGTGYVWEAKCQQAPALPEICNGQDDDCNGKIDDIADLGGACTDGARKGACAAGKWACVTTAQGTTKTCLPAIAPTAESCNGKDDDCDGIPDNLVGVCNVQDPKIQGTCRQGTRTCVYDTTKQVWEEQCKAKASSTEVCNGQDDDCNGTIDDVQGAGRSCVLTNQLGACREGVTRCQSGQVVCVANNPTPLNESCNNADDDCDGKIDNNITPRPCQTPCGKGTEDCRAGQWINCTAQIPQPEGTTCNGKDDDCDGTIDNFGPCALTTVKGICAQGEKRCDAQKQIVCTQVFKPVVEVDCNGKDDDCDGKVDETFAAHNGKLCVLATGNGTLGYVSCQNGNMVCLPPPNANESWLPPGTFQMGRSANDPLGSSVERPVHQVKITQPFAMMRFETTRADFLKLAKFNPDERMSARIADPRRCRDPKCPAHGVSWHDAANYATLLSQASKMEQCYSCSTSGCTVPAKWSSSNFLRCPGYRLPTEAEWEYAYRAGSTTSFYNNFDCSSSSTCTSKDSTTLARVGSIAWFVGNAVGTNNYAQVQPVGQKQANAWFLHDMAGNGIEWVQDWYGAYPSGSQTDPLGPSSGTLKVLRGGAAYQEVYFLRASYRTNFSPVRDGEGSSSQMYFTVRLARSLLQPFYCTKDDDCKILPDKHTCNANTCVKASTP